MKSPSVISLCFVVLFLGCQKEKNTFAKPPPPEVTVAPPVQRDVTQYFELPGVTEAWRTVEVRARVGGYLQKIHYVSGTRVKEGDVLFTIDPAPYQAALDLAQAEVESAKADLGLQKATVARFQKAAESNAVSKLQVLEAEAKEAVAKASVQAAEARRETAQLNVGWTRISTPMDGFVAACELEVGDLISEGGGTLLTTVVDDAKMYAWLNVAETVIQQSREQQGDTRRDQTTNPEIDVFLGFGTAAGFPHKGVVDYADPAIDSSTGTLRIRAIFDNEARAIIPGSFVRLRVPIGVIKEALLVPERAIGTDQSGRYVFVVNDKNKVEYRPVTVGRREENLRVVSGEIRPDDMVITVGLLRARPGAVVNPQVAKGAEGENE